jgi:hypothetical protein
MQVLDQQIAPARLVAEQRAQPPRAPPGRSGGPSACGAAAALRPTAVVDGGSGVHQGLLFLLEQSELVDKKQSLNCHRLIDILYRSIINMDRDGRNQS